MKWNMILASLVLSVGLCTQGFGFELLDRMLGISGGGCETKCCDGKGGKGANGCAADKSSCDGKGSSRSGCGLFGHRCKDDCDGKVNGKNGCDGGKNGGKANGACGCDGSKGRTRHPLFGGHSGCDNGKGNGNGCDGGKNGGKGDGCISHSRRASCYDACKKSCMGKGNGNGNGKCGADNGGKGNGCDGGKSACDSGCRRGLLDRIFGCGHDRGCDGKANGHGTCGCDGGKVMKSAPAAASDEGAVEEPMPPAPVVDPSAFLPTRRNVVPASTNLVR